MRLQILSSGDLAILSRNLIVLDALQGDTILSVPFPIHDCCEVIGSCLVASDDGRLVAGSVNNGLMVVDVASRETVLAKEYGSSLGSMGALAFAPTGAQHLSIDIPHATCDFHRFGWSGRDLRR